MQAARDVRMSERFIGVDRSGEPTHQTDHLYYVATRISNKRQKKCVVRLTRARIEKLRIVVAEWREKIAAIMMFYAINAIFHPGYSIQIDKDFLGSRQKKVKGYLKRLFGIVHYGKEFWADPPVEFLPKEHSELIRHADAKAKMARHKKIQPDASDPNIEKLLEILEEARRKGIV